MATYVMLTRLSPEALTRPGSILELEKAVHERISEQCPEARWVSSYAILGSCDYLDVFEAPNEEVASKVSLVVRSFGHATTETWMATPWSRFRDMVRESVHVEVPARR